MHRRTKIICTIGPAVSSLEKMLELIDAGMNVARINFSHGTQKEHGEVIERLKKARALKKVPLAIMLDTKGPEIRVGALPPEGVEVVTGQKIKLVRGERKAPDELNIHPSIALDPIEVGHVILFDDGYIISKVVSVEKSHVLVEIQNDGVIKSHKGVNIPNVNVPLPAMTEQDISDICFGCGQDVDYIAASFIRSAEHIRQIKQLLFEQGKPQILVLAKIENALGLQNFDEILQVADGIMVARGDLGVELPIQEVPVLQKMMIRKCLQAFKPVITATQMLESMIKNPRPTRAEVSDVANAIYDSTSAVMLSGETAVGKYPIQTVQLMCQIVEEAERDFPYREFFHRDSRVDSHDISASISLASVKTAYSTAAKAIFAFTSSGATARMIARYRPEMPIIALTESPKTYNQMALLWGVIPIDPTKVATAQEAFTHTSQVARSKEIVEYGDLVVVTSGAPFGVQGTTNMMMVESIGEVLVRGQLGTGPKIQGLISLVISPDDWKPVEGRILVISKCDPKIAGLFKHARGIILQNRPQDLKSEKAAEAAARALGIPLLVRADEAMRLLKEGDLVTLDAERGIVYKGALV